MVKTFKNLFLRNQETDDLETYYTASSTQVLPYFSNGDTGLTLTNSMIWLNLFPNASAWVKAYTAHSHVSPSLFSISYALRWVRQDQWSSGYQFLCQSIHFWFYEPLSLFQVKPMGPPYIHIDCSWCQGLAVTSACGSSWTFLFTLFAVFGYIISVLDCSVCRLHCVLFHLFITTWYVRHSVFLYSKMFPVLENKTQTHTHTHKQNKTKKKKKKTTKKPLYDTVVWLFIHL